MHKEPLRFIKHLFLLMRISGGWEERPRPAGRGGHQGAVPLHQALRRDQGAQVLDIILLVLPFTSVADPDPHVFGPPGSGFGSISQRYRSGSGSGSFYHQAKKVRKTLIPTALRLLFDCLSLKMMYMYLQKVISKNTFQKISFLLASWKGQWRK